MITSGSVNVYEVKFQFDNDWDDLERIAVFRVGKKSVSMPLDDTNTCKIPWECVCETDIGKEVQVGVYGMVDTTVVLPTVWAGLGNLKEGCSLGNTALPPTPSVAEQVLAQIIAARDQVFEAIRLNGGIVPDSGDDDTEVPEPDNGNTEDEPAGDGDVATDDEVNDALDGIFG